MTVRVEQRSLHGTAVCWDGTNADALAELAGDQYTGTYATAAMIRHPDGEIVHVRPGWWVIKWDGEPVVTVCHSDVWGTLYEYET